MFYYCPLASGSKGNCIFVRAGQTRILVDCGLSLKALQTRLHQIGESLETIQAVFITHEHSDHIAGLRALVNRYSMPIICNMETAQAIGQALKETVPCHLFTTSESFDFGHLKCLPFSVPHDAIDPVGFRFSYQDIHLGICADLGIVAAPILMYLKGCHMLYLEANHDPQLVELSARPIVYKQRVLSRLGHLSNTACAHLLQKLCHDGLKHVFLAHLSQDCNTPECAHKTVSEHLAPEYAQLCIEVAPQDYIGSVVGPDGIFTPAIRDKELACT